jgi:hypothetical protein
VDVLLRARAVVLFVAGAPAFLVLAAMFVGAATVPPPENADVVPKFALAYVALAPSGLLSASGCLLWAVARMACPRGPWLRRPLNEAIE